MGRGSKASGNSDKPQRQGLVLLGLNCASKKLDSIRICFCPELDFPSISSLPSTAVSLPYASCPPLPLLPLLLLLPTSPLTHLPPLFLLAFSVQTIESQEAETFTGQRSFMAYVVRSTTFYGLRFTAYVTTP